MKRLFRIDHAAKTRENFSRLFHPFSADIAEYRRARLLNEYVLQQGRNRDLYLSFVNFAFFGEEAMSSATYWLFYWDSPTELRACERLMRSRSHRWAILTPWPCRRANHALHLYALDAMHAR